MYIAQILTYKCSWTHL